MQYPECVGNLAIYRNKKTGNYLVQAMNKSPDGFVCEYDAPIPVVSAEMAPPLAPWLIAKLKEYSSVPFEQEKLIKSSSIEYRRFWAKHHSVGIMLYDDGGVRVQPFRRGSGGYAGRREDAIWIRSEEMEEKLVDAILDRFTFLETS